MAAEFFRHLWYGCVCANTHIILSKFWHKRCRDHNIVLAVTQIGICTAIYCTCGKEFWDI